MQNNVKYLKTFRPGRPWVGRVTSLLPDEKFVVHWFGRQGRSRKFIALFNSKEDCSSSELDLSTIMFWSMSEKRSDAEFHLSNFYMETINEEYKNIDSQHHS